MLDPLVWYSWWDRVIYSEWRDNMQLLSAANNTFMSAPQLHTEHTVHFCDVTLTRYELCGKWGKTIEGIEVLKNASILEREILVLKKISLRDLNL